MSATLTPEERERRILAKMDEIRQKELEKELEKEARLRLENEKKKQWIANAAQWKAGAAQRDADAAQRDAAKKARDGWFASLAHGKFARWTYHNKRYLRNNKNHIFHEGGRDEDAWVGIYYPETDTIQKCECPDEYYEEVSEN
jgi:hypothetical protein